MTYKTGLMSVHPCGVNIFKPEESVFCGSGDKTSPKRNFEFWPLHGTEAMFRLIFFWSASGTVRA